MINKVSKGGGNAIEGFMASPSRRERVGFTPAFTDSDPNPLGEVVQGEFSVKLRGAK